MFLIYLYNALLFLFFPVFHLLARLIPSFKAFLKKKDSCLKEWQDFSRRQKKEGVVLFHVASVGELEQVRPIIKEWEKISSFSFCLSYFSPSVPSLVKDFSFVSYANYIPWDRSSDMESFFSHLNVRVLVLNQYELWPNLIFAAKKKNIPIVLLNISLLAPGIWPRCKKFLRSTLYKKIDAFVYLDEESKKSWGGRKGKKEIVLGNPRVDRVLERKKAAKRKEIILIEDCWKPEKETTIVAGSTWEKDAKFVLASLKEARKRKSWRLILVPHEPNSFKDLEELCREYQFSYSYFSSLRDSVSKTEVLFVDRKGFLLELYALGSIAHVGGGFSRSIHSIIEPASHGLPLSFGPRYKRFSEALELINKGAAFPLSHMTEYVLLAAWWELTSLGTTRRKLVEVALEEFLSQHRSASVRMANFLKERYPH